MTNSHYTTGLEIAVYLGLGSNIGDREANLRRAISRIRELGLEISCASSIYETQPVGFTEQPWFLNQVIVTKLSNELLFTDETVPALQAEALLSELLNLEREMGRERTVANGPRVIDIDLLLFGDKVIAHTRDDEHCETLRPTSVHVPHPRMHLRRFVLEPLCEIAPKLVHPVLRKTSCELLASLKDDSQVRVYSRSTWD